MADPSQRERTEATRTKIQETAKWLIASSAGVGAALIAGSQLSNLGKLAVCLGWSLQCSRLWLATAGVLVGLTGVAISIRVAAQLLVPRDWTVEELVAEACNPGSPITRFFANHQKNLQGFKSMADMNRRVDEAMRRYQQVPHGKKRFLSRKDPQAAKKEASAEWRRISVLAQAVIQTANKVSIEAEFRRGLRRLIAAAAMTAIGIVLFAWAANPPASPVVKVSLRGADLSGLRLVGVVLQGADLREADLTDTDLTGADLSGARLDGARLEGVSWSNTICPDSRNSDDVGGTCLNHLSP